MAEWVLRTDGGARGNPGPAGIGFVLEDEAGAEVCAAGRYLGETTNNVAEYEALLLGLESALAHGVRRLRVCSDSELVVRQVNGVYKVKHPNIQPLHRRVCALVSQFESVLVGHVRREENKRADELANQAMDARTDVGDPVGPCEGGIQQQSLF